MVQGLWDNDVKYDGKWESVLKAPGFDNYMTLYRFKQFRQLIPLIVEKTGLKNTDPWWQIKESIDAFNNIRKVFNIFVCLSQTCTI